MEESQYLEGEVMEEGQEEWLSEGVLTDDDYNPAFQQTAGYLSSSQDEAMALASADDSQPEQMDNQQQNIAQQRANQQSDISDNQHIVIHQVNRQTEDDKHVVYQGIENQQIIFEGINNQRFVIQQSDGNQQIVIKQLLEKQQMDGQFDLQQVTAELENSQTDNNIEETLNHLENAQNEIQTEEPDLPAELSTFLTRKGKPGRAGSNEAKAADDDGNDTDDLLRVLGDGEQKDKDRVKRDKDEGDTTDGDDSFVFERRKPKNYEAAKTTMRRAEASKALAEDDLTECSSDEESTATPMKTIKKMSPPNYQNKAPKISVNIKPGVLTITPPPVVRKTVVKRVIHIPQAQNTVSHLPKTVSPAEKKTSNMKQYTNKRLSQSQSQAGSSLKTNPIKIVERKEIKPPPAPAPAPVPAPPKAVQKDHSEDAGGEMNETTNAKSVETQKPRSDQRIMAPELMEEEAPTDTDSEDQDDCMYDELPSSESDDQADWFTLDIRAERAGDYLPLLGERAYELLLEEKNRVAEKLETLKNSLRVLTDSGRQQAEQLRQATHTAAELDAMLQTT